MSNNKIHYAWWIMISCCVFFFVALGILVNCLGIFFVPICEDLGFTRASISLYVTIFNLALVVSLPLAGYIFPRFNIRWILGLAMTGASLGFALMSQFNTLPAFYMNAVIRGICYAFILYLPVPLLIGNWFKQKVGLALGIALASSGIGGAIFNPLGSSIITQYGWRTGFIALGLISFCLVMPFIIFVIRYKPEDKGLKPYGYERAQAEVKFGKSQEWSGVKAKTALQSLSFYCMFIFAGLVSLCAYLSPQLPGYANSLGFAPAVGAFMVSCVMIGQLVGKIGIGFLNDKIGVIGGSLTGCIIGALGMILLIAAKLNVQLIYVGAFLFGIGFALPTVEPPLLVKKIFGSQDYSAIFSYVTVGTALLGGLGTYIFGYIYDMTQSFYYAIVLCLASYLVSAVLTVLAVKLGAKIKEKYEDPKAA